jgi:hypothetical protein
VCALLSFRDLPGGGVWLHQRQARRRPRLQARLQRCVQGPAGPLYGRRG